MIIFIFPGEKRIVLGMILSSAVNKNSVTRKIPFQVRLGIGRSEWYLFARNAHIPSEWAYLMYRERFVGYEKVMCAFTAHTTYFVCYYLYIENYIKKKYLEIHLTFINWFNFSIEPAKNAQSTRANTMNWVWVGTARVSRLPGRHWMMIIIYLGKQRKTRDKIMNQRVICCCCGQLVRASFHAVIIEIEHSAINACPHFYRCTLEIIQKKTDYVHNNNFEAETKWR